MSREGRKDNTTRGPETETEGKRADFIILGPEGKSRGGKRKKVMVSVAREVS